MFYYVKLSCPRNKDQDSYSFGNFFEKVFQNQNISNQTLENIPNFLDTANTNDLVFVHIGGDSSNKRSYFSESLFKDNGIAQFENGIYGLAKIKSIFPEQKKLIIDFISLKERVRKLDLYSYPQFLDNLGCATKGIPNQAGLYALDETYALSFIEYLHNYKLLDSDSFIFENYQFQGKLNEAFKQASEELNLSSLNSLTNNHNRPSHSNKGMLPKPFILLAGISGTGKSRFVRKQAEAWPNIKNFELVAVRPDWHEPSDLLGYTLRMKNDPEFVSTAVLKFMVKAWLAALNSRVTLGVTENKITASYSPETPPPPFWLCLDEMNLAPVEQYFADYLSIIETREWSENEYSCQPILKAETIQECSNMQEALELNSDDEVAKTLWAHIQQHGLAIPFNLIVAGTVNMDETTHGFSRKVIDRALSLDFGEFAPNNFGDFFKPDSEKPQFKTLSYPTISQATANDENAQKTIEFLQAVNQVLEGTLFEIAYRALNECLLAVECEQPSDEKRLQAVWDDFLMMKILPRIEGDEDKLASPNMENDNILTALENVLKTQLSEIWESNRPDLLRDNAPEIECRSKAKIDRMQALLANGFTSFWP